MRRLILAGLVMAALAPTIAQAQTAAELRHDRREVEVQRQDTRRAELAYREDWRDYRRAHPEAYRGPRWVGPRGYAYRPVAVGYRFRPEYYDRRYWIDPYRYHLRPVYGPQRWVRYGNDVLLIDVRTGQVLEVNGGFFF